MTEKIEITTWADGFGRWHADVMLPPCRVILSEAVQSAAEAIAQQLAERSCGRDESVEAVRSALLRQMELEMTVVDQHMIRLREREPGRSEPGLVVKPAQTEEEL